MIEIHLFNRRKEKCSKLAKGFEGIQTPKERVSFQQKKDFGKETKDKTRVEIQRLVGFPRF